MNEPKTNRSAELEAWLRQVVADCLKRPSDPIDPHVPLTRYGLDSCSAIQLTAEIASKLQRSVPETLLLTCPSLSALRSFMLASNSNEPSVWNEDSDATLRSMLADSVLPADICPDGVQVPLSRKNILLTGATGFLGPFLLRSLLRSTDATVHCLVRQPDGDPLERVRHNLEKYDLWDETFRSRLQGWNSDLQLPQLGLAANEWDWLASHMDTIYHCGASVNWVLPYDALRSTNVIGTQNLLRLACQYHPKPFHFVSSLSTCHTTSAVGKVTEQDETLSFAAGNYLGYAQSKCVAESLVRRASERGLPATIHRPSLIIGDSPTSQTDSEDLLSSILCGCIAMGAAPDLDWMLDCCTVDFVAQAIVELSHSSTAPLSVSHLVNPTRYHWREVVLWLNLYGYPLRLIPYRQWLATLRIAASEPTHPLYRLRSFFFARPKANCHWTLPELYEESRRNSVDSQFTDQKLVGLGLKCPSLGAGMLHGYVSALIEHGAIPAVHHHSESTPGEPILWDRDYFEPLLRRSFDEPKLKVLALSQNRMGDHASITTELSSWGKNQRIGLWRNVLQVARLGKEEPQTIELILKSKPIDRQVIEVAEKVGSLCDPNLGELLRKHRNQLGIVGCHNRELQIYRQKDPRFVAHVPRVYATMECPEREEWLLVLESLSEMRLFDSTDDLSQWRTEDVEIAIQGLAQLHSVGYERQAELTSEPWLQPMLTAAEMESMSDLWRSLVEYSSRYFSAWLCVEARDAIEKTVSDVGSWWTRLEQMPCTLIHNDFNPRNIALRKQHESYRLCAYDWELATIGVPQHDLAEFLCFVLPHESSPESMRRFVERHRSNLEAATGRRIDPEEWEEGFRLSLRYLIVNRFPMYCLMHTFREQSFLPRLIANWWRLSTTIEGSF